MQVSYSLGNSILDNTNSMIYGKGKIMYHLNLPYRKICDSDYYSIRTKVQAKNLLWRTQNRNRKNSEGIMQMKRSTQSRGRSVSRPYTHAHRDTTQKERIKV